MGLSEERLRIAGDVPAPKLHQELARCRLYLHPLRWTSLGLALLEAMHLGMPVLALATTEASRAIPHGAGLVSNDVEDLQRFARRLLDDPDDAYAMGMIAREAALQRYGLNKFLRAWDELLAELPKGTHRGSHAQFGTAFARQDANARHDANARQETERTHP